jgi:hypothetical protein
MPLHTTHKLRLVLAFMAVSLGVAAVHARQSEPQPPNPIYAQRLVTQVINTHPDMLDVIFHVTPPNSSDNVAIAAYTAKERGAKSGEDDLGVIATGKPLVEVQKDGVRIGVLLPLKDGAAHTIGALGLMYDYRAGQDEQEFLRRSEMLRDELAIRIPSRAALFGRQK